MACGFLKDLAFAAEVASRALNKMEGWFTIPKPFMQIPTCHLCIVVKSLRHLYTFFANSNAILW